MEAKLLILLFRILICTLLISFISEGQSVEEPDEVKVFYNYMDSGKLNPFQQFDNIDDGQGMLRQLAELEKSMQNPPNLQFPQFDDINAEQQLQMQEEFENSINNYPTFGDANTDLSELEKQMDKLNKLAEDAANIKIPPLDFKVSDDVNDFFSFKTLSTRRVILHYVVLLLSVVLLIMGIARCMRKKTTSSPPSNRRFLLWLTLKKKDADQDESSGDGVGSQESSGDKTRLIV